MGFAPRVVDAARSEAFADGRRGVDEAVVKTLQHLLVESWLVHHPLQPFRRVNARQFRKIGSRRSGRGRCHCGGRRVPGMLLGDARQSRDHRLRLNRLGQETIHPRRKAALFFLVEGKGRHCQDFQLRKAGIGANHAGSVQTIHLGHLHIHQHDIPWTAIHHLVDSLAPILGLGHDGPLVDQDFTGHQPVGRHVVDQQYAKAGQASQKCRDFRCLHACRAAVHFGNGGREAGCGNRLEYQCTDFRTGERGFRLVLASGGDNDDARYRMRFGTQPASNLYATHARHVPVEKDHAIRVVPGFSNPLQGSAAAVGEVDRIAEFLEQLPVDGACNRIVVDYEHALVDLADACRLNSLINAEWYIEEEGSANAEFAGE